MVSCTSTLVRGRQHDHMGWAMSLVVIHIWFHAANLSIVLGMRAICASFGCAGGLNHHLSTASQPKITHYTLIIGVQGISGNRVCIERSPNDPLVSVSVGRAPAHLASEGSGLDTAGSAPPSEAAGDREAGASDSGVSIPRAWPSTIRHCLFSPRLRLSLVTSMVARDARTNAAVITQQCASNGDGGQHL